MKKNSFLKKIFRNIIIVSFFIIPGFAHADITTNMNGWWKLDEGSGTSAIDSSANGYNGTINGGAAYVAGKIGPYALNLVSASSQFVGSLPVLSNFMTASDGTMSAWVYPTANGPAECVNGGSGRGGSLGGDGAAILQDGDTGAGGYAWMGINPSGNFCFGGWDTENFSMNSPSTYALNQWYMVTWVHTGGNLYGYVNGVQVVSGTFGNMQDLAHGLTIGQTYSARHFDGYVDDVRMYSRGLSSTDVMELYQYGAARHKAKVSTLKRFTIKVGKYFSL